MAKFWIETPDGDEEQTELFVGEKSVGSFNHDQHGWQGMRDAEKLFENIAKALKLPLERR
jgi:hypothetical protein